MADAYYARHLNAQRLKRVYEIASPPVSRYLESEIDHLTAKARPGDRILELGCGYGRVLAPLTRLTGHGCGIDTAPANIVMARAEHPELHLLVADAACLPFCAGSFDLTLGVQNFISACRVPPEHLLAECLRVTRPGGRVALSSYAEAFWPHRLAWFRQQAAEGLVGPIDEAATGDGVIVCTDGFRATTFRESDFTALAAAAGVVAEISEVAGASLFCEISLTKAVSKRATVHDRAPK